jgi:hypothetical protein
MTQLRREELAELLRGAWENLPGKMDVGPVWLRQADAVLAKLAELETECTIAPDWVSEKEAREQVAQAELAAYVAACKAMCPFCRERPEPPNDPAWTINLYHKGACCRLPCDRIRALITDWHRKHDPKPCEHSDTSTLDDATPGHEEYVSDVFCNTCGWVHERGWKGDWHKPVDEPQKGATV